MCESARNTGAGECVRLSARGDEPRSGKHRVDSRRVIPTWQFRPQMKVKPFSSSLAAFPLKLQQHLAGSCRVMAAVDYQTPRKAVVCRPEAQRRSHFETCLPDRRRE